MNSRTSYVWTGNGNLGRGGVVCDESIFQKCGGQGGLGGFTDWGQPRSRHCAELTVDARSAVPPSSASLHPLLGRRSRPRWADGPGPFSSLYQCAATGCHVSVSSANHQDHSNRWHEVSLSHRSLVRRPAGVGLSIYIHLTYVLTYIPTYLPILLWPPVDRRDTNPLAKTKQQ